jgi:predicted RNA polymerase sigma factor
VTAADPHRTIDAVWRMEAPRLIAALTRMVRDVGLAEDFAQDAFVAALDQWSKSGVPENPGAWLMTAAKHRVKKRMKLPREELDSTCLELARTIQYSESCVSWSMNARDQLVIAER